MAPNVDQASDAMLLLRYDELYNNSADFKSSLHNVVTSSRALLLVLDPGVGAAEYGADNNSIKVWRQSSAGVDKTDEEIRNDIFFELHNAKKSMTFQDLSGGRGYNVASLANDSKKAAGYALAVEWVEWINVAQCTVLANIVNRQSAIGQLLQNPPEFQPAFNAGPTSWLKFSNYLQMQVTNGHTAHYDSAATPGGRWIGTQILQAVAARGTVDLEITSNEFSPPGRPPRLNSRSNPFTWELVKALKLNVM